ncbi:DUF192 domain-containing protein [Pararhizobium antarcticum]|uniref:DUF192 domain-containing protein n=1 Tax=Pararhizobium antarcticum TaxID=1798805 RepID=A0A657LXS6_9HYPH|nr:DUF192 domain-containing protein [Pararhizobium antarcticum]OJF93246.1 hypothetical protein AX761_05330 [Rhizobium sp. 58]OJG00943.1 hypothetical protein AX760_25040 [Pararhizobium antarcticum]
MRMSVRLCFESAVLALFLFLASANVQAADLVFPKDRLTIETADGKSHVFEIELAVDADHRQQGLMNRRQMAPDHGMLFDFGQTRRVMMWMKNTYLALDMLFIGEDGRVANIRENAVPLSEAIIDSGLPVAYVLELNAGTVRRLGIAAGDQVETPQIANRPANAAP